MISSFLLFINGFEINPKEVDLKLTLEWEENIASHNICIVNNHTVFAVR